MRPLVLVASSGVCSWLAWGQDCSWIQKDNCLNHDEFACSCRATHPEGPCTPCNPTSSCKGSCCGEACTGTAKHDCLWIVHDNCLNTDVAACSCRSQHPGGPCTPCNPTSSCKSSCCGRHCTVAAPTPLPYALAPVDSPAPSPTKAPDVPAPVAAPTPSPTKAPDVPAPVAAPTPSPTKAPVVPAPVAAPNAPAKCMLPHSFPAPTVSVQRKQQSKEQQWMDENWPGYLNGVSLGGQYVIEDWMFYSDPQTPSPATLQLASGTEFDQLKWCEALLSQGELNRAYATMDCHLNKFYDDNALDLLADFGINAIRLVVGYWLFDDIALYPDDQWVHEPSGAGKNGDYGVNPDGFITPGTRALSNMLIKLHNRNMKVLLDMHALPGCSSPRQSYAGVHCEAEAPNTWNGQAHDGISGGHTVHRADDGKTWTDVYRKLALERVVPWIKYMNRLAPGTIIGYEVVNEPDIASSDASLEQVRSLTLELGTAVKECFSEDENIWIGVGTASKNYPSDKVAQDYLSVYPKEKELFVSDVHHYFAWSGCIDYGTKIFSVQCACESNLPGGSHEFEDTDWANWMRSGVFDQGWKFYVGEWSVGDTPAHSCQGGLPKVTEAQSLWHAQKWGYLSQYTHYNGKANNGASSFVGDFYWNGRMGFNWNPDPDVCAGPSSSDHFDSFSNWDWSLLRLIKLSIVKPLSTLGWTPQTLASHKDSTCAGTWPVMCDPGQVPAAPPGGQPGMRLNDATIPASLEAELPSRSSRIGQVVSSFAGLCVAAGTIFLALRRRAWLSEERAGHVMELDQVDIDGELSLLSGSKSEDA